VPAGRWDIDAIEERGAVRAPVIALVGVEPHLAVAERSNRLALGIEIVADQHHVVPVRRLVEPGGASARLHPPGDRSEMGGKPALVVLGQVLVPEQQHRVLMPGILDRVRGFVVERTAELDAADFRADGGVQFVDGDGADFFCDVGHGASLP